MNASTSRNSKFSVSEKMMTVGPVGGVYSLVEKLKIATIVIGDVDVALTLHSYFRFLKMECIFLTIIIFALILSVLMIPAMKYGVFNFVNSSKRKYIEPGYHGAMAILLVIGASMMMASVNAKENRHLTIYLIEPNGNHRPFIGDMYVERMFATVFGFLNAAVYVSICFFELCTNDRRGHGHSIEVAIQA